MTTLTPEAAKAGWREAERELTFWAEHRDEFVKAYPDQFVAAHNGAAVATAPDLAQLIDKLRGLGFAPNDVWSRFFDSSSTAIL